MPHALKHSILLLICKLPVSWRRRRDLNHINHARSRVRPRVTASRGAHRRDTGTHNAGASLRSAREKPAPTLSVRRSNVSVKNPDNNTLRSEGNTGKPYENLDFTSLPNQRVHIYAVACSRRLVVQTPRRPPMNRSQGKP